jgi:hypothetical protein
MVHATTTQTRLTGRLLVKMGGKDNEVESDETFVGGRAKNMHASRRAQFKAARESSMTGDANLVNKAAVWGVLDRESRKVRATGSRPI